MKVTIEKCQCSHPSCNYYGVSNGTFYQGNGWDKETAIFVAWCFNSRVVRLWWKIVSRGML